MYSRRNLQEPITPIAASGKAVLFPPRAGGAVRLCGHGAWLSVRFFAVLSAPLAVCSGPRGVTTSLCLPTGSTYCFTTSSSRGSNQKNGGSKKKSPQEEEGMCVPERSFMNQAGGVVRAEGTAWGIRFSRGDILA